MKKIKYLLFLIIGLCFTNTVYANDIKSITMDIYVDNFGDAHIKEVWNANLFSGTEGYKPYYNMGNSKIINYQVSMNGRAFTTSSYWNVDASFESKKYRAGIHTISDGYELCFGISEYGNNTYTMEYTITGFVARVDDSDMIYWTLIPHDLSDKPKYVYIKIYSDFKYEDTLDVWGYGYGNKKNQGYAYVYDGYIELTKDGELDSDEYMTVLVKFPKGTFNTANIIEKDFEHYYEMAEEGAVNYNKSNFWNIIIVIITVLFNIIFYIAIAVIFVIAFSKGNTYGSKRLKFNKDAKKLKDVPYFRDIPCNKDIFKAYWVACEYNLIRKQTDFLGAILLKWLKNGNIENTTVQSKFLKKEERAIKFINYNNLSELEQQLYGMMLNASIDGTLESNEFTSWCKKNYSKILTWFNTTIDDVTNIYIEEGVITKEKGKLGLSFHVSEKIDEQAKQMAGLKKFLNEFSNIKERESIEVNLWEEYLMYAQIFGIAEKVAKEFKKLYPDIITDDYYNDVIFIHHISYTGVQAASAAKSRAESYSSGGGGFSSSGGGGGSFGGGGGGGGFR